MVSPGTKNSFSSQKPIITSVISMKGGTAKTTTAVNLSAYLALAGFRVLLIDLDPQNFATICLGVETQKV
jgi:chromosome partitioning protein